MQDLQESTPSCELLLIQVNLRMGGLKMLKNKIDSNRKIYLDYLRILSTIAVMTLHVSASNWYTTDVNSFDWAVFNFYDSIVRWAVPVFVMISGSLFLSRDDIPVQKIYFKYVFRLCTAYYTWNIIYYLCRQNNVLENLKSLFHLPLLVCLTVEYHYHLWFIPMIIGIYICIPIIKKIVQNRNISLYFLTISFIFWSAIPQVSAMLKDFGCEILIAGSDYLSKGTDILKLNFVSNYIFYFILGYEISRTKFSNLQRIGIYALGVIGFAFTIIVDWVLAIKTQTPVDTYYGNTRINVLFEALAIFELYKNIRFESKSAPKFVLLLSKWSFGAYLVHALVISIFSKFGFSSLSFLSILAVPAVVIAVFICSFAISAIIHQIPILNKYIV